MRGSKDGGSRRRTTEDRDERMKRGRKRKMKGRELPGDRHVWQTWRKNDCSDTAANAKPPMSHT
jgi:hypothetical protein